MSWLADFVKSFKYDSTNNEINIDDNVKGVKEIEATKNEEGVDYDTVVTGKNGKKVMVVPKAKINEEKAAKEAEATKRARGRKKLSEKELGTA